MKIRNSIECWILREANSSYQVLLLHRAPSELEPTYWQPITGGIKVSESPELACLREVSEETGLLLKREALFDLKFKMDVPLERLGLLVKKQLFVGIISNDLALSERLVLSPEHDRFSWTPIEEVSSALYWDSNLTTFEKVVEFARESLKNR